MHRGVLLVIPALVVALPAVSTSTQAQDPRRILSAPFGIIMRALPRPQYRSHRLRKPRAAHRRMPQSETPAIERARIDRGGPAAAGVAAAGAAAAGAGAFWPVAAPDAFEDMLGYAFWPREYGRPFWSHGPRDIMLAMTAPAAAFGTGRGDERPGRRLPSLVSAANAGTDARAICAARVKENAMRPLDRVAETITLTSEQTRKLEGLRASVRAAIDAERSACSSGIPATQPERLRAMIDGLWAMRYAEFRIRPALATFQDSLSDAQKAQLADEPQTVGSTADVPEWNPAVACSEASSASANPFAPIERSLRPTPEQRKSLQMLYGASMEMSQYLISTCPAQNPDTPVARLDAAGDRLMALLHAAMNIEPMLGAFYAGLSEQQRQRFNAVAR